MNVWSFLIALVVVLALIGVAAWLFQKYGANRLGMSSGRGRPPRLAVIDAAHVDGRRRLVLVRRDNVEHLILIGGPTDVVVEPNIVRAVAPSREAGMRPAPSEPALRGNAPGADWPLQPEPADEAPAPVFRPAPEPPRPEPRMPARPRAPEPRAERPLADSAFDMPHPAEPEPPRRAPRMDIPMAPRPAAEPRPPRPMEPMRRPAAPPPAPSSAVPVEGEKNLADMAQKLEAALRRPIAPNADAPRAAVRDAVPSEQRPADVFRTDAPPPAPDVAIATRGASGATRPPPSIPAAATRPDIAQDSEPRNDTASKLFGDLEQEMASLLGRPKSP